MNDAGLGDYYQGELRRGAERVCRERDVGLWVYGGRVDWTPSGAVQRQVFDLVHSSRIDGIVIAAGCIASYAPLDEVLERLRERCGVPICAVGGLCPGVPSLLIDNQGGAARVIDHMVREHGRRQIAYIAGPERHEESEQRLAGTRSALARHGLELREEAVGYGNFSPPAGRDIVEQWLRAGLAFDAIIAANDEMAVGALEVLREQGIQCPDQVSLAGFDDSASARFCEPALTTVRQPVTALGAAAATHLIDLCEGRAREVSLSLETDLVVRESCGCHAAPRSKDYSLPGAAVPVEHSELLELLTPVLDTHEQRERWSDTLRSALDAERAGVGESLARAFTALLEELTLPHVHVDELQRAITTLRARAVASNPTNVPEGAFHAARTLVSAHASRVVGERNLQASWLLRELRRGSERLGTALSLEVLKEALSFQLPKLGVRNALVSLYPAGTLNVLEPLVCLQNGVAVDVPEASYPSEQLVPSSCLDVARSWALTILPLTFQLEKLGVVVMEIPARLELYAILREQIGSAIKTVQLHQEVLSRQREHAEAQEEKRVTNERLKSLGVIAGGVAHDLNNVLGPLLALPQAIQDELKRTSPDRVSVDVLEDLETIQEAGQRAAYTIHDLLALGRVDEIPKTVLDLNELLDAERRTFLDACRNAEQISVHVSPDCEPLVVRASRSHVLRAISNLVINAADAMEGAGRIDIRARGRRLCERLDSAEAIPPGEYAVIEVQDFGAGIPEQHLARIFEPFFSVKRSRGTPGTGLGLAIVRRVVEDSAGYVHVRSQIGRGTTFALYFPRQRDAAPAAARSVSTPSGGSERILVVDDEPLQLRVARRVLGKLGYSVTTSTSGDAALQLYLRTPDAELFDLVIVDMMMPGTLNGIATIEQMRKVRPRQKALVATGFAPERMELLASERGLAWLAKPYTLGSLSEAVRNVLNARG
jgi:DNA-binding LacI/PurR family transcriptional regulator/signal transduction histidine kinase/ActR/RegA family two-component response regulator